MKFNTQKITLISVLFMGYLKSNFLRLAFPFITMPISVIWNAIMMEYLGYSVFIYYILFYVAPFILENYIAVQQFEEAFIKMACELAEYTGPVPESNLVTFLGQLCFWGFNIFYSWLIHRIMKKSGCFPRTII